MNSFSAKQNLPPFKRKEECQDTDEDSSEEELSEDDEEVIEDMEGVLAFAKECVEALEDAADFLKSHKEEIGGNHVSLIRSLIESIQKLVEPISSIMISRTLPLPPASMSSSTQTTRL